MKVYLAAQYSWRERIKAYAKELEAVGVTVTSSWLRERSKPDVDIPGLQQRFLRQHAESDIADIKAADALILFTVAPSHRTKRGGRHVEFGMALAWGKRVVIVGPRENIFCFLPQIRQFETFRELKEFLAKEAASGNQ